MDLLSSAVGTPNPPATLTIQSDVLGAKRRIYLQLPDDFHLTDRSYPVLVVLDGEWNFELARSHVQFYSEFAAMGAEIPKMIVVGIENLDRDRDYLPTPDRREVPQFPTAGEADRFLLFLKSELFPFLEDAYRAAANRTIVGWSFGGQLALHAATAMPDLFQAYLCIGPSVWWDDERVIDQLKQAEFSRPTRMVITVGSEEKPGPVYDSTKELVEVIESHPIKNLDMTHLEFEGVGHGGGVPLSFSRGLRALFPQYRMKIDDDTQLSDVVAHYKKLSDVWGFNVVPTPWVLQTVAMNHWSADRKELAVEALDWYIERHPNESLVHAYKGIYLIRMNHREAALASLRTALDLELARDVPSGVYLRGYREHLVTAEEMPEATRG